MPTLSFKLFPLWLWCLPFVIFGVSAPLWLELWEPSLFLTLNRLGAWIPAPVWAGFSLLGNGWAVLALTAPLLVLAPRLMWAWLCAAPFAAAFARFGKELLVSPRPAAELDTTQFRIVGEHLHNVSMPSGHTTTAVAVVAAIFFALPPAYRKKYWWILLLGLAAGLSRIAVGAHWPGDVAVGAALGLLAGLLGNVLLAMVPTRWFAVNHLAVRLQAVLVAAAVYVLLTEQVDFAENAVAQSVLAALGIFSLLVFAIRNAKLLRAS